MSDVLDLLARANPVPEARQAEMEARASALANSWRTRPVAATETSLRGRWRLAVVAIVVSFVLVAVGTALALRGHWLDFSKAEPAPPKVVLEVADFDVGAPPGMESGVVAKDARRVPVVDNHGTTKTFWVAPTRRGGFCVILDVGGGCDKLGALPLNTVWGAAEADGRRPSDPRVRTDVYGAANATWVDSLLVRFADGDTARPFVTWVSQPINHGFFYYVVPPEHRVRGHEATRIEALDAGGNVVTASYAVAADEPSPPVDAIQDEKTAVARAQTPDGEAVLWLAPTRYRTTCAWIQLDDRAHSLGCYLKQGGSRFAWMPTRRAVVLAGQVDPRFHRVELDFADYSHIPLKLVDGFLLFSIPPDHLVAAKQLVAVRVLHEDGSTAILDELVPGLSGCYAPLPTTATCR